MLLLEYKTQVLQLLYKLKQDLQRTYLCHTSKKIDYLLTGLPFRMYEKQELLEKYK
jgi:hypothetical protein